MNKRASQKPLAREVVQVTKLVHGGQGLAELSDGRKVFVWNALPGETVRAQVIKQKSSYAEAIAEEIMVASADRVLPKESNYLSTSPWQMMNFAAENRFKKSIVEELFAHEKVSLPAVPETIHGTKEWAYRNKMEYSFWGDDDGLHLALHQRGTHGSICNRSPRNLNKRIDSSPARYIQLAEPVYQVQPPRPVLGATE